MKTIFYKILYKDKDVVYVGVSTRPITKRFKEHIISKSLDPNNFSIVEFDSIEHPEISSIKMFYTEYKKVAELERKYIKEELEKGSKLLNISAGGEWGSSIISKLKMEDFFNRFKTYDGYENYRNRKKHIALFIRNWAMSTSRNNFREYIRCWIRNKNAHKYKKFLQHWVECTSKNKLKHLLIGWVRRNSPYKLKRFLLNWANNKSQSKFKIFLGSWYHHRSDNKYKVFVRSWVQCRSRNKTKIWMRNWVTHRE